MKAPSLLPPGRSGESRGRGRVPRVLEVLETMDDAGGERMKPPLGSGEFAMIAQPGDADFDYVLIERHLTISHLA